jgi:tRNA threonylcarbamoyladenosine biosynthesis protein TsaB
MVVMGIETSTLRGGVALVSEQGVLSEHLFHVRATHAERLLPSIDRLLSEAGLALPELDGIAVAIGPGSFTGLRIGLSTAKGLAAAAGKAIVGVPTLEAMAWTVPFCAHPVCPVLDARKGEIYAALFRHQGERAIRLMDDAALSPEELIARIHEPTVFLGDGLAAYGEVLKRRLNELLLLPPLSLRGGGRPAAVAELGLRRLLAGEADDVVRLRPRYVRPSEAELKRHGAQARSA